MKKIDFREMRDQKIAEKKYKGLLRSRKLIGWKKLGKEGHPD